ncbi:MAG: efflux RND transporter periplasmic adaptor subunit [Verrucomicrobia bacterium]|nr:efflux RND transporter periplasmic adaptor subunit [Verrucomicrobiota bacterium]
MKTILFLLATSLLATAGGPSKTVILDENGVKNLRIETQVVEETTFEESLFALGEIAIYPGRRAVISNDHRIEKGQTAVLMESRQPGNPPPTVDLPSPISGLVSQTHIVPGEPIDPDKVLAEVLDLSEVYAIARVPQHLAGQLKQGQAARISVPAVPGRTFDAELEHLGAVADAASDTVEAAFHVNNPDFALRPGMRAEFSIVVGKKEGVFSIPRAALQGDATNRFVYVKDFEIPNAFVKTPVVVGSMNASSAEIVFGLLPADEIVTRGGYSLAFAGGGTMSLKEALDAAHGHEHAEDGSELPQQTKTPSETAHNHEPSPFWMIVSGGLFVLLVIVAARRKGRHAE